MAGHGDRSAWRCSSCNSAPRVPRSFSPRSYNHLSHYRPNNILHSTLRDPVTWSRPDCYNVKIYGRGRLQRQRRLVEGTYIGI